jgi:hypothetical protein
MNEKGSGGLLFSNSRHQRFCWLWNDSFERDGGQTTKERREVFKFSSLEHVELFVNHCFRDRNQEFLGSSLIIKFCEETNQRTIEE